MTPENYDEYFETPAPEYGSTEADNFTDAILNNALNNAPQTPDDNLPRYAMSFLLPIALMNMTHADMFGDFNLKDQKTGWNKVNLNWYPAFELMPLYGCKVNVPFENFPSESDVLPEASPFVEGMHARNNNKGYDSLFRSPRQCADIAYKKHKTQGLIIFEGMTGAIRNGQNAAQEEYRLIRKLLEILFPIKNRALFPESFRIKNGVRFVSPFLDEMREFLTRQSLQRLFTAHDLNDFEREKGEVFHKEIMKGVAKGIQLANSFLNEVEAEMKEKDGMRKGYDAPNLEVPDAPLPTELYCLAHTNRVEVDDKQLQASANIGTTIADKFNSAMETLAKVTQNIPSTVPQNTGMSDEQVRLLLERQQEEFAEREAAMEKRFGELLAAGLKSVAVGQSVQTETSVETVESETKKLPKLPKKTAE